MSLNVILPNGKSVDLADTAVIRSVSPKESDAHNAQLLDYLKNRPNFTGVVPDTRYGVAIERPGQRPVYTTGSVAELINAADASGGKPLAARFDLVDGGAAAIAKTAKVHLIRPLSARDGSTARATIWVDGASTNGLYVAADAATIKRELGTKAAHLVSVGDEGFIDRSRIRAVSAFDATRDLQPGQERFTIAVRFDGVYRPQYFRATEAVLRGAPVLDLRAGAAVRPGADGKRGGSTSAPQVA